MGGCFVDYKYEQSIVRRNGRLDDAFCSIDGGWETRLSTKVSATVTADPGLWIRTRPLLAAFAGPFYSLQREVIVRRHTSVKTFVPCACLMCATLIPVSALQASDLLAIPDDISPAARESLNDLLENCPSCTTVPPPRPTCPPCAICQLPRQPAYESGSLSCPHGTRFDPTIGTCGPG